MIISSSQAPFFVLSGNGPASNRGCQALMFGTCHILKQAFPNSSFLAASFGKDSQTDLPKGVKPLELNCERKRWRLNWWMWRFRRHLRLHQDYSDSSRILEPHLTQCRALLSIGGDNYAIDYGCEVVERLIALDSCAKRKGIPVVIWGASIGPFTTNRIFEKRIAKHLTTLDLIVVREKLSLEYLQSIGVINNVVMEPDPAFVLEEKRPSLSPDIESFISRPFIGLNLSPLLARYKCDGNLDLWTRQSAAIVSHFLDTLQQGVLLTHHVTSITRNASVDDHLFLTAVYNQLDKRYQSRTQITPRHLSCEELKWVIGRSEVFIGARTHATIAAFSSGTPCLSIAYSLKARGINEWLFSSNEWIIQAEDIAPDTLMSKVLLLLKEKDAVHSHLASKAVIIKEDAFKAVNRIAGILQAYTAKSTKSCTF